MKVDTPVPDVGTPFLDSNGFINPVWHQFFFTLLRRTGSEGGIDAAYEQKRTDRNEADIVEAQGLTGSIVASTERLDDTPPDSMVYTHGIHQDPALHAVATPATNGFMSAEDKARLDGIQVYETGTWSPAITYPLPGDLAITYADRLGTYTRFGNIVVASFQIVTSSYTFTTSSGELQITGIPFPSPGPLQYVGALIFEGLDRTDYTQFVSRLRPGSSIINVIACAPGQFPVLADTDSTVSGENITLIGTISYYIED